MESMGQVVYSRLLSMSSISSASNALGKSLVLVWRRCSGEWDVCGQWDVMANELGNVLTIPVG